MSARHRSWNPGELLGKDHRRRENRKVRQEAKRALATDPEVAVLPVPVRSKPAGVVEVNSPRVDYRHWKQPFWKRRTAMRQARLEAEQELIRNS